MDVISILNGVKDKVLDAKNYDLLKRAYALQNENIEQLKTNNEALKESNKLLKEKLVHLEGENESLKQSVDEISQRVSQLDQDSASSSLSEVALAILDLYRQRDTTGLFKEVEIIPDLNFSKIQIESAIDELKRSNMIKSSLISHDYGIKYSLTEQGKKYLI
ncbi:hypothetical protein ES707_17496 [subsurface metagenome]